MTVLTEDQQAEFDAMPENDKAEALSLMAKQNLALREPTITEAVIGGAKTGVQAAIKAADALGVPARVALAKQLGVDKPEDMEKYLSSLDMYPGSSELMGRPGAFGLKEGVPQGMELSDLQDSKIPAPLLIRILSQIYAEPGTSTIRPWKHGPADPSVRGVFGSIMDMASNPVTYVTGGAAPIMKGLAKIPLVSKIPGVQKLAQLSGGVKSNAARALELQFANEMKTGVPNSLLKNIGLSAKASILGNPAEGAGKLKRAGEAALALTNSVINPIGNTFEYGGRKIFEHGVRPLDNLLITQGKGRISPDMVREGMWGSSASLYDQLKNRGDLLETVANSIASEHRASGRMLDPDRAMELAREYLESLTLENGKIIPMYKELKNKMGDVVVPGVPGEAAVPARPAIPATPRDLLMNPRGTPEIPAFPGKKAIPAVPAVLGEIGHHATLGPMSYPDMLKTRTSLYRGVGPAEFEHQARSPVGVNIRKLESRGLSEELERGAEQIGRLDDFQKTYPQWSRILSVQKAARDAAMEGAPNLLTGGTLRPALGQGIGTLSEGMGPYGIAAKILRAPGVTTPFGLGLEKLTKAGLGPWSDAALRSKYIESLREPRGD